VKERGGGARGGAGGDERGMRQKLGVLEAEAGSGGSGGGGRGGHSQRGNEKTIAKKNGLAQHMSTRLPIS
jgi:hypothetical protein